MLPRDVAYRGPVGPSAETRRGDRHNIRRGDGTELADDVRDSGDGPWWSNERFSIMKTTTCSIPHEAGSGNAASEDVMGGESGPTGRQPSATAALVKNVRRSIISRG